MDIKEEYKQEALKRASAFEQLIRSESWVFIKSYIENTIKTFSNRAIRVGFKDMEEYQFERGKVEGLTALLSSIESDLAILKDETSKPTE